MTPQRFSAVMALIDRRRSDARSMLARADRLEDHLLALAGVESVNREPGFPNWTIRVLPGRYFHTPEDAIRAADTPAGPDGPGEGTEGK